MLNCISKPNTKYAELLIKGHQGNVADPSGPYSHSKTIGGAGFYELHVSLLFSYFLKI